MLMATRIRDRAGLWKVERKKSRFLLSLTPKNQGPVLACSGLGLALTRQDRKVSQLKNRGKKTIHD